MAKKKARKKVARKAAPRKRARAKTVKRTSRAAVSRRAAPTRRKRRKGSPRAGIRAGARILLNNAVPAVAGAVGAGLMAKNLPIQNNMARASMPLLAGLVLSMTRLANRPAVKAAALGMMASSGVALFRTTQFGQQLLAGSDPMGAPIPYYNPAMLPMMGEPMDLVNEGMGEPVDLVDNFSSMMG